MAGTEPKRFKRHSGLIAAVGALVVFTSWAVTNTSGQRFERERSAIVSAKADEQLSAHFADLRQTHERLVSIGLQIRADVRATTPGPAGQLDPFPVLFSYYSTRSTASQVRELQLEALRQSSYARLVGTPTATIDAVLAKAAVLLGDISSREQAIDLALATAPTDLSRLKSEVDAYQVHFRARVLPQLKPLFESVAEAKTANSRQADARLGSVAARVRMNNAAALILYALGTVLALGGKFLETAK